METQWAAEHLQVIRTLMERAAIYRRALAPVMTLAGSLGLGAAALAYVSPVQTVRGFAAWWLSVSLVGAAGALLLVRGQALKAREPVWSPPARRVGAAAFPALAAGLFVGVFFACSVTEARLALLLPIVWAVLYGLALLAAGFFTSRGLRLLGGIFMVVGLMGLALLPWLLNSSLALRLPLKLGHLLMGGLFGALQLSYGVYLYFTEKRRSAS